MASDTKLTVLIVEQDDDTRCVLERIFQFIGCSVVIAKNGLEGLMGARASAAHAAFIELRLPDITGLDVDAQIWSAPECADMLLVAFTCLYTPDIQRDALAAGFARYVPKPAALKTFSEIVRPVAVANGCVLRPVHREYSLSI